MDTQALQDAISAALAPVAAQFNGEIKGSFTFTPVDNTDTGSFDVTAPAPALVVAS